MYANRNSLTILAVLLLLGGVGFLWYRSEAKELDQVSRKHRDLAMQLHGALEVAETLSNITAQRDSLQRDWEHAPKKILNAEEPAFSLSYINWLIRVNNLDLDFDFYLNDKKQQGEFTAFSYTLNGEGNYRDICSLIWYMTRNPLLYQIRSVTFKRNGDDPRLLNFVIMFEGYTMTKEWEVGNELEMVSPRLDWNVEFGYDAFASQRPVVIEPKPVVKVAPVKAPPPKPEEPPDLFDVRGASLLAITKDKAYLRAKDGKVVSLKAGDRVRRGRLTVVDQRNNRVEFLLKTDSGSSRLLRLNLEYN